MDMAMNLSHLASPSYAIEWCTCIGVAACLLNFLLGMRLRAISNSNSE